MEHRRQRRQAKKQAIINKIQLGKEFKHQWKENYGKGPSAAPLEERKAVPNTNENTGKEAAESGSQELISSSAPNIPDEKYASDLPDEEIQPLPNINKDTGKETKSGFHCSQDLATSSVPEAPESRASLERPTPPNINYNPGRGSQELTSSSASYIPVEKYASDLPAEENLPLPKINKDTGKETEVTESGSQCSQDMTTSSVPKVLPDWVPEMDNIHPSAKEREAGLTFGSLYDSLLHPGWSPSLLNPCKNRRRLQVFKDIVNEIEFVQVPNTNHNTGRETESSSHASRELTVSSVLNKTVEHSTSPPDITSQKEFLPQPEKNKNTGKEPAESGSQPQVSQDLTSSSAPSIPVEKYARDLPAKANLPLPKINKDTAKETEVTESGSQDLTTSSVPKVLPDGVPQMDNIHPSARKQEVGLTFGSFYNSSLHPHFLNTHRSSYGSQELTSSSAPSIPVEKHVSVLPAEENLPLPKINKDTGKETESGSQCSQDLTTSSVPKVLPGELIFSMEEFPLLGPLPKKKQ